MIFYRKETAVPSAGMVEDSVTISAEPENKNEIFFTYTHALILSLFLHKFPFCPVGICSGTKGFEGRKIFPSGKR